MTSRGVGHGSLLGPFRTVEDYVHRIGRTGRAGAVGNSLTFITNDTHTPDRVRMAKDIVKCMEDVKQVKRIITSTVHHRCCFRPLRSPSMTWQLLALPRSGAVAMGVSEAAFVVVGDEVAS